MKIGIIGAHGTGKTRFALKMAADLKEAYPGEQVGIVSEVVRDCPYPVNRDTTWIAQQWIWHMQFIRELEAEGKNEIIVCDRTVLDSLVYSYVAGLTDWVHANLWDAVEWMKTYDVVYFLRPGDVPPSDDGFRDVDLAWQKEVDHVFAAWIEVWRIRVVEGVGAKNLSPVHGAYVHTPVQGEGKEDDDE